MGKPGAENIETTTSSLFEKIKIEHIFETCKERGFSCAMYRLPDSLNSEAEGSKLNTHLIIDLSAGKDLKNLHLDGYFLLHKYNLRNLQYIDKPDEFFAQTNLRLTSTVMIQNNIIFTQDLELTGVMEHYQK